MPEYKLPPSSDEPTDESGLFSSHPSEGGTINQYIITSGSQLSQDLEQVQSMELYDDLGIQRRRRKTIFSIRGFWRFLKESL